MTEQPHTSPDIADQMLAIAQRALQRGDMVRARALLRMMSAQYPRDRRIWQARADVAETDEERQLVLDQLARFERQTIVLPETRAAAVRQPEVTRASAPTQPAAVRTSPAPAALAEDVAPLPPPASYPPGRIRWPLYLITAVAVAILLAVALVRWVVWPVQSGTAARAPTQPLATQPASPPPATQAQPATVPVGQPEPTALPVATAAVATQPLPTALLPTPEPPTATPLPTLPPRPTLAPGTVIQEGPWNITLLRPEHALLLSGSIGELQPAGRFALTLLSIGYSGDTATQIPADLFLLEDNLGKRYQPVVAASGAYLATFGRGQYGDVSLDEVIPANAGNVSVPVIFDVPASAQDLRLLVGGASEGWQVAPQAAP